MSIEEQRDKLLHYGEAMRNNQKSYFREKDKVKKRELLIKSKQSEHEFDNTIFNIRQMMK